MARYFLDTNCLIGASFAQDVWFSDSTRIFTSSNSLYTGETVVREFCSGHSGGSSNVSLEDESGLYEKIRSEIQMSQLLFDQEIQIKPERELTPENVSKMFINEFDIMPEVESRIQSYFRKHLDPGSNNSDLVREAANELIDYVLETSERMKNMIEHRVNLVPRRDSEYPSLKEQLQESTDIHPSDIDVLLDAYFLKSQNIVSQVVTGDKSHLYNNREYLNTVLGLRLIYLRDKFAQEDTEAFT